MGITIVSAPVANTAALPGGTALATAGEGLPGEFAALLGGQLGLLALAGKVIEPALAAKSSLTETDEPTSLPSDPSIPLDPGLAFILAPAAQAAGQAPVATDALPEDVTTALDPDAKGRQAGIGLQAQDQGKSRPTTSGQAPVENELLNASTAGKAVVEGSTANIAADQMTFSLPQTASAPQQAAPLQHPAAAAGNQPAAQARIDTPIHDTRWSQHFGEKIVWLAKHEQASAQITLNPPQLGPMQISLQLNGDQASAIFASPHAEVRQAIQDSLPQLKEMLASAGINLGQADIGANMAKQNREMPFQSANGQRSLDENAILAGSGNIADSTTTTPIQRGRGMVDLFA